jgi:hypothetical protein
MQRKEQENLEVEIYYASEIDDECLESSSYFDLSTLAQIVAVHF